MLEFESSSCPREGGREGGRASENERKRPSERARDSAPLSVCPGPALRPSCGRILARSLARTLGGERRTCKNKTSSSPRRLLLCLLRPLPDSVQCDVTCTIDPETSAQAERISFPCFLGSSPNLHSFSPLSLRPHPSRHPESPCTSISARGARSHAPRPARLGLAQPQPVAAVADPS